MLQPRSAVAWWRPLMCLFSMPVAHVGSTRIFARPEEGDRQLLVYEMTVSLTEDGAMILPIPVAPGSGEDAVQFIDLSACPAFFDELASLFPAPIAVTGSFGAPQSLGAARTLVVHEVGDYIASFVPSPSHFNRLDARFRLPDAVWDAFPGYHDHGFCVFKLKTKKRPSGFFGLFKSKVPVESQRVHPMAFTFPRRDPGVLFFPTVHVHDGEVHPTAHFDHDLFCQTEASWEPLMEWRRSAKRADALEAARAWVDPKGYVFTRTLEGELPNRDTTLLLSKLRARTEMTEYFRIRMRAAYEHVVDDGKTPLEPAVKRWMRVSERERVRVRESLTADLVPIFQEMKDRWRLVPFVHDAAKQVTLEVGNERIEPQEVHLMFATEPSPALLDEIRGHLQSALDRATNRGPSLPPSSG